VGAEKTIVLSQKGGKVSKKKNGVSIKRSVTRDPEKGKSGTKKKTTPDLLQRRGTVNDKEGLHEKKEWISPRKLTRSQKGEQGKKKRKEKHWPSRP